MQKKFNKVAFLQSLGFLDKRLNPKKLKLESSLSLGIYSHLCLVLKMAHCVKLPISLFWKREAVEQLFIGNFFNYLDPEPRFWMGLMGNLGFELNT